MNLDHAAAILAAQPSVQNQVIASGQLIDVNRVVQLLQVLGPNLDMPRLIQFLVNGANQEWADFVASLREAPGTAEPSVEADTQEITPSGEDN